MPQKCTYANNTQTTCNIGLLTKKDKQHSRSAFPLKANRMRWGRLQDMVVTTKGLAWHMRRGSWSIRLVHYKKKRNHKVGAQVDNTHKVETRKNYAEHEPNKSSQFKDTEKAQVVEKWREASRKIRGTTLIVVQRQQPDRITWSTCTWWLDSWDKD